MATEPERILLTYADYAQISDDRNRYELVAGEIQVTPSPGRAHQTVVMNRGAILHQWVRQHRLGRVWSALFDVVLTDTTVVQPDLLFVARERLAIVEARYVRGAPDLVIEVISPSTVVIDRQVKRQLYARHGVIHSWLFDPERHRAEAYQLSDGAYRRTTRGQGNEPFAAPPFAELTIPLAEVWED